MTTRSLSEHSTGEDAHAEFRARARAFLAEVAPPKGSPDDYATEFQHGRIGEAEYVAASKRWQATLAARGWAGLAWPREYGGQGRSPIEAAIFAEEARNYGVSDFAFAVGLNMVGPMLMQHGTPEQRRRYLPPILTGDEVWCQLFSEPTAGSDLANVSTRAVRDGDEWVVRGHKVWTSKATFADFAVLLARTDPDVPKHRGMTYFICDMRTPGVTVSPIKQMNGLSLFNEVFLDDVRIPHDNVVGEVNGGWAVAMTTLASERQMLGEGGGSVRVPPFEHLVELARERGQLDDPRVRQELAGVYTRTQILRWLRLRLRAGGRAATGAEPLLMKLTAVAHQRRTGDVAAALLGPAATLVETERGEVDEWVALVLTAPSGGIAGGTDEIQRNVLGERHLGLPGEPRVDRDRPFRAIPR